MTFLSIDKTYTSIDITLQTAYTIHNDENSTLINISTLTFIDIQILTAQTNYVLM